jgi:hypothetical protein
VAGRPPFDGQLPTAIVEAHISQTCPRLIDTAQDGLLPGLSEVVEKCLKKEPSERYQNIDKLVTDLKLVLSGDWAKAQPPRTRRKHTAAYQNPRGSLPEQSSSSGFSIMATALIATGLLTIGLCSWAILTVIWPTNVIKTKAEPDFIPPEPIYPLNTLHKVNENISPKPTPTSDPPGDTRLNIPGVSKPVPIDNYKYTSFERESIDVSTGRKILEVPVKNTDKIGFSSVSIYFPDETSPKSEEPRPPEEITKDSVKYYKLHFGYPAYGYLHFGDPEHDVSVLAGREQLIPADKPVSWVQLEDNPIALGKILQALPNNYLTKLVVSTRIDEKAIQELERQKKLTSWVSTSFVGPIQWAALSKCKSIDSLEFGGFAKVDSAQLLKFLTESPLPNLKSFRCKSPVSRIPAITKVLSTYPKLDELYISECNINEASLENISTMSNLKSLTLISPGSFLTDDDLLKLRTLKNLRKLIIGHAMLTENSVSTLASMKGLKKLDLDLVTRDWSEEKINEVRKALNLDKESCIIKGVRLE